MTHNLTHYTLGKINTDRHGAGKAEARTIDIQALWNTTEHRENLPLSIQVLLPLP
jgi:hypothetical protein